MQPRDGFDGVLIVLFLVVLYLDRYGSPLSTGALGAAVEALLSLNVIVYLVVAGVLGVAFVGYIAIYLPHTQNAR